jgi:hypothetical protein
MSEGDRYYEAGETEYRLMLELIKERFSFLTNAKIKIVMDRKPKVDKLKGVMIFAMIKLANEVERFLSKEEQDTNGVDYIVFINDFSWEMANTKDKKRILSHELRHAFVDEEGNYKIIRHDIEDFYAEIKLNDDDPMWSQSLGTVAMAKLDQMKADEKAAKAKKK